MMLRVESVALTLVWSGVVSLIIFLLIKYTIGLRMSEAEEAKGLDFALHGEIFHD